MSRSRSYPILSLPDALVLVRKVQHIIGTAKETREEVMNRLGYSQTSGCANRLLSALKKYGLIICSLSEGVRYVQISETIDGLLRSEIPDGMLYQVALKPPAFAELHQKFGPVLSKSPEVSSYLDENGYAKNAHSKLVDVYMATMMFVTKRTAMSNSDKMGFAQSPGPPDHEDWNEARQHEASDDIRVLIFELLPPSVPLGKANDMGRKIFEMIAAEWDEHLEPE